jgi:hypothetical protein
MSDTFGTETRYSYRPFSILNPLRGCNSGREHYFGEPSQVEAAKGKQ